jgi:hypothetical protein
MSMRVGGDSLALRDGERLTASWLVGDAGPDGPASEYGLDLDRMIHHSATERFGHMRACRWAWFSGGESEYDRADFMDELTKMGANESELAVAAREWDECVRPIAVTHIGIARIGEGQA